MEWLNINPDEAVPYRAVLVHGQVDLPDVELVTKITSDKNFPQGIEKDRLNVYSQLSEVEKRTEYHLWTPQTYLDHGYFLSGYLLHNSAHIRVESQHFPVQHWPVVKGYFKMVLFLDDEPKTSRFRVIAVAEGGAAVIERELNLTLRVNKDAPKVRLAMVIASDSEELIDSPNERPLLYPHAIGLPIRQRNNVRYVADQLRMTAYLWQAFTGEQMFRNGKGRRSFQLEDDELLEDSITCQSGGHLGLRRRLAKVHVLRSKRALKEWRKCHTGDFRKIPKDEQDHISATGKPDFFGWFLEEINDYPAFKGLGKLEVSGLLFDSRWDQKSDIIRTHSALGGGNGLQSLGMFGSHCVYSWPSCFERIVPCLLDSTPIDLRFLSNDSNQSGEYWRAFNIGAGAMLHELGHALSLWHSGSGIMSRGYNELNRAFMTLEPRRDGRHEFENVPITAEKESGAHWTRIDCSRLWAHRCFVVPGESTAKCGGGINAHLLSSFRITTISETKGLVEVISSGGNANFGLIGVEVWLGEQEKPNSKMVEYIDYLLPNASLRVTVPLSGYTCVSPDHRLEFEVVESTWNSKSTSHPLPVLVTFFFSGSNLTQFPVSAEKDLSFRFISSSLSVHEVTDVGNFLKKGQNL